MTNDPFREQLDRLIVEHFLELDGYGNFAHPPKTDEDLDSFIQAAYGIRMPKKVLTPGHRSPFQFLADLFFERTKNALGFANRSGGKALALDTEILTADGWSTMGEICVGDFVFAPDGKLAPVTTVSGIFENHECYEVVFDKVTVTADAEHLWFVQHVKKDAPQLMTTRELFRALQNPARIGYKYHYWIPLCAPLEFDPIELPVHPYVLGAWLGDGCRYNNLVYTWDDEILARLRQLWPNVQDYTKHYPHAHKLSCLLETFYRAGLSSCPRKGGVKFIPDEYLFASAEQRYELLCGLMDTDGTIAATRCRCEFDSTDRPLAEGVHFLVGSLGAQPNFYEKGPGSCNGKKTKDRYRVTFCPTEELNPFHLSRKRDRWRLSSRKLRHKIREVRPVKSVPVRCIGVGHPSHLYLATRCLIPTHNTYAVALLNHLDMVFKPGCEICSAGAIKDQAEKCYRYFREFCALDWFQEFSYRYQSITGRPLFIEKDSLKSRTVFGSRSRLEVITASEKGLRGQHPSKSRLDEIDEMEWHVLQIGLSMAQSDERLGVRGQNVFTSTRQRIDGVMQRMLDTAAEKGIEVYEWNIWETLQKCTRRCQGDPAHGDCPIYTFCQGRAHHCDGYFAVDDFVDKVRLLDREAFETEWLNLRPARHKLVFPDFGSRHIMTPPKLHTLCGFACPELSWHRISGLDFGSSPGHPFVYLKFAQIPNHGAWLLFYEYVAEQKLIKDHATAIKQSPGYLSSEVIYADWDAQDRLELKSHGVRTRAARKGRGSVNMGLDFINSLLRGFPPKEEPMLYVWHECIYTIAEWGKYSWPIRADGRPDRSGNPEKEHDHTSDATRMCLFSDKYKSRRVYRGRRLAGI